MQNFFCSTLVAQQREIKFSPWLNGLNQSEISHAIFTVVRDGNASFLCNREIKSSWLLGVLLQKHLKNLLLLQVFISFTPPVLAPVSYLISHLDLRQMLTCFWSQTFMSHNLPTVTCSLFLRTHTHFLCCFYLHY